MTKGDSRRRMLRQNPGFRTYNVVTDPRVISKVEEVARNLDVLPDVLIMRLIKSGLYHEYGIDVATWDDDVAAKLRKELTKYRRGTETSVAVGERSGPLGLPKPGIDPDIGLMI